MRPILALVAIPLGLFAQDAPKKEQIRRVTAQEVKSEWLAKLLKKESLTLINQDPGAKKWNESVRWQFESGMWNAQAQDEADVRNVAALNEAGMHEAADRLEGLRLQRLQIAEQKRMHEENNAGQLRGFMERRSFITDVRAAIEQMRSR